MQKLKNDGSVQAVNLVLAEKDASIEDDANKIFHLSAFTNSNAKPAPAVWLDSDDDAQLLKGQMDQLSVIAINFPAFADGRGFSLARILREQLGYTGELLAAGAFMQDQLFYLKRCGFDGFLLSDTADVDSCAQSLLDFSESYQAAHDQPTPLFKRRQV